MTLTDFLLARIAEDEAVARAASHQKVAGPFHGNWVADSALLMANGALERADRVHIARHDPARVLADCEAKRRIVEREGKRLHEEWRRRSDEHRQTFEEWFTKPYGETLRDLALPYADHSDYREDWRP